LGTLATENVQESFESVVFSVSELSLKDGYDELQLSKLGRPTK